MKPNTTEAMTQAMNDCITAERFEAAVGYPPKDDDLDRSNCLDAGKIAHQHCGWCLGHDKPRFICGCALRRAPEPKCTCTGHYGDLCLLHQFARAPEPKPTLQEIMQAMLDEMHKVYSIPPEYLAEGKNAAREEKADGKAEGDGKAAPPVAAPNYSAITHSLCAGFGIRKFGGRDNGY